jgi:hypothetical protein
MRRWSAIAACDFEVIQVDNHGTSDKVSIPAQYHIFSFPRSFVERN